MINLVDGRGQLGTVLKKIIQEKDIEPLKEGIIYHTWNVEDKSKDIQRGCYERFRYFLDQNPSTQVIFISTNSQIENYYNYYKQFAEAYLLTNHERGYVIRLPTLIGKGTCEKFRNDNAEAFGEMELITLEDAAREILKVAQSDSLVRSFRIKGAIAPAQFVKDLIQFGRFGNEIS